MSFNVDLDTVLGHIGGRKDNVTNYIKKHFVLNQDFVELPQPPSVPKNRGGSNKVTYLMTSKTYDLLKSSYNLKHKYMPLLQNLNQVSTIVMSLENQTIGFIHNTFSGIYRMIRQKREAPYYIDLVFLDHSLALECDENGHSDRDQDYEKEREDLIAGKYMILRFNPNSGKFDISLVMRVILDVIVCGHWTPGVKWVGDRP